MISVVSACRTLANRNIPDLSKSDGQYQSNNIDPLGCIEKDELNPIGLKKAWKLFTDDGRYRLAWEEDFNLPDMAIQKRIEANKDAMKETGLSNEEKKKLIESTIHSQYHKKTICPVLGAGDFNHDGNWYDLAVIVVDTTKTDLERFGIVIFNAPKINEELYIPYWLYQNQDLSRTVFNAIRDDLIITELREDGSIINYAVIWDSKQNKYSCNKV